MASLGEAVYCTMLLSDNYLPGAMVLAHSLRDHGTKAKLAVLVTLDSLKTSTIDELRTIYDDVIPISRIVNRTPANLYLMDRPDLISTFSKIELWKQTQYSQVVYIDADVISLRAPDELLTIDTSFAAVPDIGWPDCFNTGLMVLRPNMQDYYSLLALAQRGISFDGADQGLLNMHFTNWERLSFTYNCTPSGHYQYIPAFRHFQSTISLVHYIGSRKPWNLPRQTLPLESPYNQLLGRWWATYDRHYRPMVKPSYQPTVRGDTHEPKVVGHVPKTQLEYTGRVFYPPLDALPPRIEHDSIREPTKSLESVDTHDVPHAYVYTDTHTHPRASSPVPLTVPAERQFQAHEAVHQLEKPQSLEPVHAPEVLHTADIVSSFEGRLMPTKPPSHPPHPIHETPRDFVISAVPQYVRGEEHVSTYRYPPSPSDINPPVGEPIPASLHTTEPLVASQHPPKSHPTELTEPQKQPEVGQIPAQFQEPELPEEPPERSFSPPRMEWDASRAPPPVDSKGEAFSLPSQTYTMSQDTELFQPPKSYPEAPKDMYYEVPPKQPSTETLSLVFPWETYAPKPTRVFLDESPEADIAAVSHSKLLGKAKSDTAPEGPLISRQRQQTPEDPWLSYTRSNAWDEVPEIEKYMRSIQKPRRGTVQVLGETTTSEPSRRPSMKLTDFPTEIERPSLPVTPAPIRRASIWDTGDGTGTDTGGGDESPHLPTAEGVPSQENWNPLEKLEELQRRQSSFLEEAVNFESGGQLPAREMPGETTSGIATESTAPVFREPTFESATPSREQHQTMEEDQDPSSPGVGG
ncbi:glycogenin glucosyltransferase [Emmonsiellopsis sp. PD_33]|nr:glycogenin glucosyltransferase [Emmonsiellopsis sp. PD_33]